ncbi:MAG: RidA family protein [Flavobacteriales bacterium]|nr:RidA family protein [Flavobacteriales bacterium]
MNQKIETTNAPSAIGPYSQAILANGFLFISGQIPINPKTEEIETGIENQTHQVMKNILEILKASDLNFSNVIKSSIFIKNMSDFSIINEIYASYLSNPFPARETVEVSNLPKNVDIEISVIASIN